MSKTLQSLIQSAILKLACDGDSEALLIALNLENALNSEKERYFSELMEAQ